MGNTKSLSDWLKDVNLIHDVMHQHPCVFEIRSLYFNATSVLCLHLPMLKVISVQGKKSRPQIRVLVG